MVRFFSHVLRCQFFLVTSGVFLYGCLKLVSDPPLSLSDATTGIHLEVVQQDTLPALKILLPGQPESDPGILVLLPEHVTAREQGKSESVQLYRFSPGLQSGRPVWRRVGQALEYEMDLSAAVRLIARVTLESDGLRFHYDLVNSSDTGYDMIQAVTDPRMITPYFHDVRLERTYVHHSDGFDLVASETPSRLSLPLADWLPNRYRVSYTWPIEPNRVEKKEDNLTWYNKSRRADEPFLATKSTDGKWIMAAFSGDPGNVWTNPELTCQHADPQTSLKPHSQSSLDLKILLFQGTLDDALSKVRLQRPALEIPLVQRPAVQRTVQNQTLVSDELPAADLAFSQDFRYVGAQVVELYASPTEVSASPSSISSSSPAPMSE